MLNHFKSLAVCSQLTCVSFIVFLIVISGCAGNESPFLETKYGKVNEQPRSINSTSLFAKRLEDLGYEVTVRNRISPKINEFETVFWFPEHVRCPSDEATKAIEKWMDESYSSKTLVYVGSDYRASEDYYQAIQQQVPAEKKPEIQRLLSEAQLATQTRRVIWNRDDWLGQSHSKCDWFDLEAIKRRKSNLLAGPMVIDAGFGTAPELPIEVMMSPKTSAQRWEIQSLLSVDGEDMVYSLTDDSDYYENRIIVVQNASFLVNLAAADPNKKVLADQLIVEATRRDDGEYEYGYGFSNPQVLILESESEIPVRSTDFVNQNSWAWIAEEPLCYIVPHALLWGVLFCYVYFPIFGRPKRLPQKSTTSFRNHINALAKQLSKSGGKANARRTIEQYQESASGSHKKNS